MFTSARQRHGPAVKTAPGPAHMESMLETHGGVVLPPELLEKALTTRGQGYRVVGAQRILQAQSDPFLGWIKDVPGEDGKPRDFYIRKFRDMKGSFTLEEMNAADQTEADHAALEQAVRSGRLPAERGV